MTYEMETVGGERVKCEPNRSGGYTVTEFWDDTDWGDGEFGWVFLLPNEQVRLGAERVECYGKPLPA